MSQGGSSRRREIVRAGVEFTETKHARPFGETGVSYVLAMAPTAAPPSAWVLHSVTQPDNVVELRPSGSLDASTAGFLHARLDGLGDGVLPFAA